MSEETKTEPRYCAADLSEGCEREGGSCGLCGYEAGELCVVDRTQWTPCSPEWLDKHPNECAKAPRVASREWDGHSHYHPVNWPAVQSETIDALKSVVSDCELAASACDNKGPRDGFLHIRNKVLKEIQRMTL